MKKSTKKWIMFDEELNEITKTEIENVKSEKLYEPKKINPLTHTNGSPSNFQAIIKPKTITDLAVHPKKIKELQLWLEENVIKTQKSGTFLLITGPTGCAKTTTLQLLCDMMEIQINEWTNPVDKDYDLFQPANQIDTFLEFLGESKWTSLIQTDIGRKKIVLIKEFPNALIRSPEQFPSVLEFSSYKIDTPIVFICANSNFKTDLSQTLFTQDLRNKYNIFQINFNSCATTLLRNALRRALNLLEDNLKNFASPDEAAVENVIISAAGDLRCALNQLYFLTNLIDKNLCRNGVKNKKRKRTTDQMKMMHLKDETMGLFHGLGRVLNPKRVVNGNTWKFTHDISKIIDEFEIQPQTYVNFLHENYLKYFQELMDVVQAADCLSVADGYLANWMDGYHDCILIGLWISVLGVMVANEHKVSKWNQITAPIRLKNNTIIPNTNAILAIDQCYVDIIRNK